jgi:hypothetical protein
MTSCASVAANAAADAPMDSGFVLYLMSCALTMGTLSSEGCLAHARPLLQLQLLLPAAVDFLTQQEHNSLHHRSG